MSLDRNEKVKNNAEIPPEITLSQRDSQIKSLDDSSFDYDNEIKELSDETIDLMTAIKNNNLLQAATAIKAGARVNALGGRRTTYPGVSSKIEYSYKIFCKSKIKR